MKKIFIIAMLMVVSITTFAQRDLSIADSLNGLVMKTRISKEYSKDLKLFCVVRDTGYVTPQHGDTEWSSNIADYVHYSRIEMGRRMNEGIKYSKKSRNHFIAGTSVLAVSIGTYLWCSEHDPLVWTINETKPANWGFLEKDKPRDDTRKVIIIATGGTAVYLFVQAFRYHKKSRWMISPDGVRYKF